MNRTLSQLYGWLLAACLLTLPVLGRTQMLARANAQAALLAPQQPQTLALPKLLDALEARYGVRFNYQANLVRKLTLDVPALDQFEGRIETTLTRLLGPLNWQCKQLTPTTFVVQPLPLVKPTPPKASAQTSAAEVPVPATGPVQVLQLTVSGRVSGQDSPGGIPGVNILLKGTSVGAATDANGNYRISVPDTGEGTLIFSYIGYQTQEVAISKRTQLDVTLVADVKGLDEVVVVGYGTVRKRDLTGAVTTVKPDEIRRSSVVTVSNLLQGQVAGVVVTGGSGAPGAGTSIRIRGTNSINAGNEPLYVVDGVMLNNGNDGTIGAFTGDGGSPRVGISALATINPDDIESIEVLKDASATAIYGARGSGGVILITTKKGKAGATAVTFGTEIGFQKNASPYNMLSAVQFEQLNDEARANSVPALTKVYNGKGNPYDTRMYDEMLRNTALVKNFQVGARGGTATTTYNLSFNYFDQEGLLKANRAKRYSIRINLENQAKSWLKLGTLTSLTRLESNLISNNNVQNGLYFAPNQPIRDNTGVYTLSSDVPSNADLGLRLTQAGVTPTGNPTYDIEQATNPLNQTRIISTNYAELSFLRNFRFRMALSVDILDTRDQYYGPTTGILGSSNAFTAYGNIFDYLFDNTLSYTHKRGEHSINAVIGANVQKHKEDGWSARGQTLNDNTGYYSYVGSTLTDQTTITNGSGLLWTMASFLGRVNYGYKGRYLATVSMRADGSSRFGSGNKFGYFPSASVAWIVSDEEFLKNSRQISQLKFRASYGVTGNQEIGLYRSLSTLSQTIYVLNSVTGVGRQPTGAPNPNLSWESTAQANIGVDVGFFNNRVALTADLYRKKTTNLLYNLPTPVSSGFATFPSNIGSVTNAGWELGLNTRNLTGSRSTGPLTWSSNFNVSHNTNKITDLGGINSTGVNGVINGNFILRVGEPIGSFYGYIVDGIFQAGDDFSKQPLATPGEIKYRKTDTSPTSATVINSFDRQIIGNPIARYTFGLTNNFSYRGVDLSIFFQGIAGHDLYNATRQSLLSLDGRRNNLAEALDRWRPDNPTNTLPKAIQAGSRNTYGAGAVNTLWIEDGSYVRLKNITLGYTLPAPLSTKLGMSSFRVYGSIQNALTLTNYKGNNPDIGDTDNFPYPLARIFSVGLNAQF